MFTYFRLLEFKFVHWKVRMGLWSHDACQDAEANTVTSPLGSIEVRFSKGGLALSGLEKIFESLLPDPGRWTLTQSKFFCQKAPSCRSTASSGLAAVNGEAKANTTLANSRLDVVLEQ